MYWKDLPREGGLDQHSSFHDFQNANEKYLDWRMRLCSHTNYLDYCMDVLEYTFQAHAVSHQVLIFGYNYLHNQSFLLDDFFLTLPLVDFPLSYSTTRFSLIPCSLPYSASSIIQTILSLHGIDIIPAQVV